MTQVRRGDIFYANLEPVVGSEQGGVRPVLVIQNNKGNRYAPTVIVAAVTGKRKTKLQTHVSLCGIAQMKKDSVVMLEQIRTIDRGRLGSYIGRLSPLMQRKVNRALAISVGIGQGGLQTNSINKKFAQMTSVLHSAII